MPRVSYIQPSGDVNITGVAMETPFAKEAFAKLGVQPHIGQRYEYKNAVNTYTETTYTAPHREAMEKVLAEDFETASFAATLVNIEYEKDDFATDLQARRAQAHVIEKPQKPRGDAAKAFAEAAVRHEAEYVIPREITIRWNCSVRPSSGMAAESSRSMTRRRACRTCSAMSAAYSTSSRTTCA